jgi:hypothetical protein
MYEPGAGSGRHPRPKTDLPAQGPENDIYGKSQLFSINGMRIFM